MYKIGFCGMNVRTSSSQSIQEPNMKQNHRVFFLVLLGVLLPVGCAVRQEQPMKEQVQPPEVTTKTELPPSSPAQAAPAQPEGAAVSSGTADSPTSPMVKDDSMPAAEPPSEVASAPSPSMALPKAPAKMASKDAQAPMDMAAEKEMAAGAGAKSEAKKQSLAQARKIPPRPEPAPVEKKRVFSDQPTVKYLSADDSNSTASPVIARKLIQAGKYVPPGLVRTYEFLNYYGFEYPPPPEGKFVHIVPEMRAMEEKKDEYSVQVAVRALNRGRAQMMPMNVILLLDTSGSMAGEPIALAKSFLQKFAMKLRPGERISLLRFNRQPELLLENHEVGAKTAASLDALLAKQVEVTDITDLERGLALAYQVAGRNYNAKFANRVVLLSDGAANAGKTAIDLIAKHAEDSDRQGIYLTGIGFGEGFNDALMDAVTDRGRGAYAFVDSEGEIDRLLSDESFVATFDVAVKDVRLKMVLPPRFTVEEFHGEQISSVASEVIPQYLSPNDQMIYHLSVVTDLPEEKAQQAEFEFEVEFTPVPGQKQTTSVKRSVGQMQSENRRILKGDALVRYAEALKKIGFPFEEHRQENQKALDEVAAFVDKVNLKLQDKELSSVLSQLSRYRKVCEYGEDFKDSRDMASEKVDAVLGLAAKQVRSVKMLGPRPDLAIKALKRLLQSNRLRPMEGQRFLALGSGPIGNPVPSNSGELSHSPDRDPMPEFLGAKHVKSDGRQVFDKHQIVLELQAPEDARSFSFDFNFFSAEYPSYVNQNYNDTFYAILEAPSTNQGKPTGITFDADGSSIEVDNNYFQRPFHPIPNDGTGFDAHGSTGWLRTSWPIQGGERFRLTFSIHDEGDAVFDSVVLLDNFQWHPYSAVGNTDPLN
jgi:Ca-activated chloride channel homolog